MTVCANAMIHRVKDYHHIFLEGLEKVHGSRWRKLDEKIKEAQSAGCEAYKFDMGS